jgi:hypothetical protein
MTRPFRRSSRRHRRARRPLAAARAARGRRRRTAPLRAAAPPPQQPPPQLARQQQQRVARRRARRRLPQRPRLAARPPSLACSPTPTSELSAADAPLAVRSSHGQRPHRPRPNQAASHSPRSCAAGSPAWSLVPRMDWAVVQKLWGPMATSTPHPITPLVSPSLTLFSHLVTPQLAHHARKGEDGRPHHPHALHLQWLALPEHPGAHHVSGDLGHCDEALCS